MGRTKLIETPEIMWELFEEYRKHIRDNPLTLVEQVRGRIQIPKDFEGNLDDIATLGLPLRRPLSLEGFHNWLWEKKDILQGAEQYFKNTDKRYEDYIPVCAQVKRTIREDQIEGGMVGLYNPSITQRLNGLVEKTHQTTQAEQPLFEKKEEDDK